MIFVDTSVWVDYFRGRDQRLRARLDDLLDDDRVALAAPVRVELLGGVRRSQQDTLRRLLGALPTYRPTDATWELMETWARQAGRRGHHFGFGDLLIAAIAAGREAPVWSLDADFATLATLGFIDAHRPVP